MKEKAFPLLRTGCSIGDSARVMINTLLQEDKIMPKKEKGTTFTGYFAAKKSKLR